MQQSQSMSMRKAPSMSSLHSMASLGYLPPGHGYLPKRIRPDKPYGPSFVTIMNRTWRGPGKKYLCYALVAFCWAILFYCGGALYFGHRVVSRMIVLHTEVLGALMIAIAILLTGLVFNYIYKARVESNRWREHVRFRGEGFYTAAAFNRAYVPEDGIKLKTGTYTSKAIKEIPKPKTKGRSRTGSLSRLPTSHGGMTPVPDLQAQNAGGFTPQPGQYAMYPPSGLHSGSRSPYPIPPPSGGYYPQQSSGPHSIYPPGGGTPSGSRSPYPVAGPQPASSLKQEPYPSGFKDSPGVVPSFQQERKGSVPTELLPTSQESQRAGPPYHQQQRKGSVPLELLPTVKESQRPVRMYPSPVQYFPPPPPPGPPGPQSGTSQYYQPGGGQPYVHVSGVARPGSESEL